MAGTIPRVRRSIRSNRSNQNNRNNRNNRSPRNNRRILFAGPAVVLLLAGTLAACSSGNGSPSSNSSGAPAGGSGTFDTASASRAVEQTWTTFFSKNTPIAQKEALLQGGTTTYVPAVQAFAADPTVGEVTADVQSVTFPSPTQADVTYSISLGGQVVENSMAGKAVYQNGKWLVADATLCGLLQLAESQSGSAASIPGCG